MHVVERIYIIRLNSRRRQRFIHAELNFSRRQQEFVNLSFMRTHIEKHDYLVYAVRAKFTYAKN